MTVTAVIDEELWFGRGEQEQRDAEEYAAQSMAALVGRIIGAKPFPAAARRLAELTRTDNCHMGLVVQVLESDPALSMRLLRLVNSAGYGLRMRCTSVRHAATLVGSDRLHQIATTAAVLDLFAADSRAAARVLEHSAVVGALSRYLGAHSSLPLDDLFACGFLHDLGKLMLIEAEGATYSDMLADCRNSGDSIHVHERSRYGFDHAVLAAHVLKAWNIPDPVPKVVAWHHDLVRSYASTTTVAAMVHTLYLADALAYALAEEREVEAVQRLALSPAASYLDISEPQLGAMWPELKALYKKSREQCAGEGAPILDAASCRPKQLLSRPSRLASSQLPKQFPCVVCGLPSFGTTCPVCHGHICPEHQAGREGHCALCHREYRELAASVDIPVLARVVFFLVSGTLLVGLYLAGGVALAAGPALLVLLASLLLFVGRHWWTRWRFLRSRPTRRAPATVTSLVPAALEVSSLPRLSHLSDLISASRSVSIRDLSERTGSREPTWVRTQEGYQMRSDSLAPEIRVGPPSERTPERVEAVPVADSALSREAPPSNGPSRCEAAKAPLPAPPVEQSRRPSVAPASEGRCPGSVPSLELPPHLPRREFMGPNRGHREVTTLPPPERMPACHRASEPAPASRPASVRVPASRPAPPVLTSEARLAVDSHWGCKPSTVASEPAPSVAAGDSNLCPRPSMSSPPDTLASLRPGNPARDSVSESTLANIVASRVLGSEVFVGTVVERLSERMADEVAQKVASRLAKEVIENTGDQLANAVAERIADAWQRASRTSTAAAGNGWTLRPRQRGNSTPRGRNPRA